jgi:hypothetical protein
MDLYLEESSETMLAKRLMISNLLSVARQDTPAQRPNRKRKDLAEPGYESEMSGLAEREVSHMRVSSKFLRSLHFWCSLHENKQRSSPSVPGPYLGLALQGTSSARQVAARSKLRAGGRERSGSPGMARKKGIFLGGAL